MGHPILAILIGIIAFANALVLTFPEIKPVQPKRISMLLHAILYSYVAYVLW